MKPLAKILKNPWILPISVLGMLVVAALLTRAGGSAKVSPAPPLPQTGTGSVAGVQEEIRNVISFAGPSVVRVLGPGGRPAPAPSGSTLLNPSVSGNSSAGSGVILDRQGHVITTYNTVGALRDVEVVIPPDGGRTYPATVLISDVGRNLALLQIDLPGDYYPAALGNSDMLQTGDLVFALGTPFGLGLSASLGIISAAGRDITVNGRVFPRMIQTDSTVNDGEEGGPLVNIRGEVVGIIMAGFMPSGTFTGIGFAMPIRDILDWIRPTSILGG